MRRSWTIVSLLMVVFLMLSMPAQAVAQGDQPASESPELLLFTNYPSQVIGIRENVSIPLKLRIKSTPQILDLSMQQIPSDWTATFRGGGRTVKAVFVDTDHDVSVDLRLEPPADVAPGTYHFLVAALGDDVSARLPIELTVKEKLPPRLSLNIDLTTLRGTPNTTFRYSGTLKNEGDEDLSVNLTAEAPDDFKVTFKVSGQEVNSLPLEANKSKQVSIEARSYGNVPAGDYPISVRAQGGEVEATQSLIAKVTGEPTLSVTAPDGRLSGRANAGKESSLKVVVRNTGTASARAVEMSSSEPSGWSVEFSPEQINEIPAGEQVEILAKIRPPEKAIAGDYMITVRARPEGGASKSADFRITVVTSTLWGVVGIALIAVAVGVVGLAVFRFGRR